MGKNIKVRNNMSVETIINDAPKYPLLTQEQVIELLGRIKKGDKDAVQELYNGNLRLVVSIANTHLDKGLPLEELVEAGNRGLESAVYKYNPSRGFKFICYATWWIRMSILQEIIYEPGGDNEHSKESEDSSSKTDNGLEFKDYKEDIDKAILKLSQQEADILRKYYGLDEPEKTLDEIGEHYNLTPERVWQIREQAIRKVRNEIHAIRHGNNV